MEKIKDIVERNKHILEESRRLARKGEVEILKLKVEMLEETVKQLENNGAIDLLKRWANVDIPDTIWSEPGEDFGLPLDTQAFFQKEV